MAYESLLGLLQEREGEGASQAAQEQGAGAQTKGKRIPRTRVRRYF